MTAKPLTIAITQGDPAGVGPEIILRLFAEGRFDPAAVHPFVVGVAALFEQIRDALQRSCDIPGLATLEIKTFKNPPGTFDPRVLAIVEPEDYIFSGRLLPGRVSGECGAAAWASIRHAVELIKQGHAAGMVTAPIHKEALKAAGCSFPGHTEMLADLAGGVEMAMLLAGGGLRVALATIHEPLRKVPSLLEEDKILRLIQLLHHFLPWFGLETSKPRIGVTGLNPHAGEGGMFGTEEHDIIAPAIRRACALGIDAQGPLPADTAFHFHREGAYDGILAMYHDQALIPVKTLDFHGGVNITMGLPFIRTSVDHGTAFDIAWQGKARPDSLSAALDCAATLVRNRFGDSSRFWAEISALK